MFVILITSIANAQEFYLGCATIEEEIAAFYATTDAPPTELHPLIKTEASKSGINNFTGSLIPKLNKFGEVFTNYGNEKLTFTTVVVNASGIGVSANSGRRRAVVLDIMTKIWIVGHPDYIVPGSVEAHIAAMYDAPAPPTALADNINAAAVEANDQAVGSGNASRVNFISLFDKYGLEFTRFGQANNSNNSLIAEYVNNTDFPSVQIPNGSNELDEDSFKAWALVIAQAIWHYGHQDYVDVDARIAEILAIDANGDGASITYAAPTFSITNGDTANISNIDISDAILNNSDATEFNAKKAEIQTAYGDQVTKFATRTARISTLENKGNGYVTVAHTYNDNVGDLFNITYDNSAQPIYTDDYYGLGYARLENLVTSQFDALSTAITEKVNELSPSVEKELNAFATGDEPTGSAPEWLPTALYASANTNTNGTVRTAFLVSLSGHGVSVTHILNDGAYLTHFRVSTGDGYDYIINWAPYAPVGKGWNQMTAESFRRLAFDVIVLKWKKIHETHNTERSDILDQTLDTDDINVILVTYADDWWIYFNNTDTPILSGGRPLDPMFYNKFTLNPHDTYMTEVEFQRLVVFVTYMRDNYVRLKQLQATSQNRNNEISNLVNEFGVTISPFVSNSDGTYHYTFNKNGNSNEYPVQSNWTHPAGTTLAQLSPDNWVKFYAKCRGIIIGL